MDIRMDKAALTAFLAAVFPQVAGTYTVEDVQPGVLLLRLHVRETDLRPGGTVSGPAMFALADVAVYLAILAVIGPEPLTVTTGASIDFMRKPPAGRDLLAEARLLKLGRTLAVGDVRVVSDGGVDPVARATFTYAIPPRRA